MSHSSETRAPFRVFLSGVIQGSRTDSGRHSQDYRDLLRELLAQTHPEAEIVCPVELNPGSSLYDDTRSRQAFFRELELASTCDVTIAYAPVATMGTAVEMNQAYSTGKLVFTISPMKDNWAVRFLSTQVFPDLESFEHFVRQGGIARALHVLDSMPPSNSKDQVRPGIHRTPRPSS